MNAPGPLPPVDEGVDLGALGASLGFLLRLAQVRVYDRFFAAFAGTEVKPGEFSVLWVIDLNPGVPQGALARALTIKPAHMTKLVARMVEAGLVVRRVPDSDRRSVHLTLTPQGRAHLAQHRARFEALHEAERAGLSETEAQDLARLLSKLALTPGVTPWP